MIMNLLESTIARLGAIGSAVLAAFFLILGGLVIFNPALLSYIVGLSLVLLGVAVAAAVFGERSAGTR